tara:strand:+ start:5434 stop:6102 length:669 start_codon:yes stop_codon:yes gene_type:complete
MREHIIIDGKSLNNEQFCQLVNSLTKEKYKPIIDPRNFDNPITIKARFKSKDEKIRFIEISPNLEINIEHTGTKSDGKEFLNTVKVQIEKTMPKEVVQPEDFEMATLQMIARKEPVIVPKNSTEEKLFSSLVEKGIFTRAHMIECPDCSSSFLFPRDDSNPGAKAFCKDCEKWFPIKKGQEAFVMKENYMEVMDGMWNKMQKLIKTSWREVVKKGGPLIPKV